MKSEMDAAKGDIETLKDTTKKLSTEIRQTKSEGSAEITSTIFEERESRRCNVVIHNLPEPGDDIKESSERISRDKTIVQELCEVLEIELDVGESARFAKRLGPRPENNQTPRPLLIGFKTADFSDAILQKSPELSKKDEPWSSIKVVSDLTKIQRKEETRLRDEVIKKNGERTNEESENWKWKVVGRRGERRIVQVEIEEEVAVGEEQEQQTSRFRGRGRGGKGRGIQRKSSRLNNLEDAGQK